MGFQIQIQIQIQIFAYLNTNTNTNTYLTPALPYWVIVLTSSSGTNYVHNEHEDVDQYGPFSIPSELVLYQSHPESLVNQIEILIELLCKRAHLALIMSLTSKKMLTNMTHMPYHPRWCHVKAILKVWWTKMKSLLSYRVKELIWH